MKKNRSSSAPKPAQAKPQNFKKQRQLAELKQGNKPKEDNMPNKSWRVICGQHAILECLAVRPKSIKLAYLRQGWESNQDLQKLADVIKAKNIKMEVKSPGVLDKIYPNHQGAIFFSDVFPAVNWPQVHEKSKSIVVVLDGIEDPHNLGAIVRTCWLMGVDAIILPQERAAGLTATVHKVACGGVEHVPVETVTNFQKIVEDLKAKGYWALGLDHKGKNTLYKTKISEKVIWCIGAEDKGLRITTQRLCDDLVRIPQGSESASYNASVAAAIAVSETHRQLS